MLQRLAYRALWALAVLISLSIASLSWAQSLPTVLTCPSVAAGTPLNPWPNCANTSFQPAGPGLIVATTRGSSEMWEASSAILLTDAVFTSAPYNGTTSEWWPAKLFTWTAPVTTGTVKFAWLAPTSNADGTTPVTTVASYQLYEGTSPTQLSQYASIPTPGLTYTTPALPPGTYFFALTAVGANGAESPKTAVISTVVPVPPVKVVAPGAPGNVTVTVNP